MTTEFTAEAGTQQIELTREFAAPVALVWRALTDPELVPRWLGPRRYTTELVLDEQRDGGRWRFAHRGEDGSTFAFRGVYHGDPSPELTIRTFEFEGAPGHVSLETMRLEDRGERTVLRAVSVFQSVADRDGMLANGMREGAGESYDRLDEVLEALAATAT